MPALVGILRQILEFALGKVLSGNADGVIKGTFTTIATALNDIYQAVGLITWAQERQLQAIQHNAGSIANTGASWNATTVEYNIALNHIIDTILPNSLRYAYGRIQSEQIVPLKQRLFGDELTIAGMQGTLASDDGWINAKGRVWVDWLIKFYDVAWPDIQTVVNIWIEWLSHPVEFANWATPPLIGTLIAYFADPNHKQSKDALMLIIARALQDAPADVMDSVEQWLVTEPN